MKNTKEKQVIKISILITSIFVIILSISYAFLNRTLTGSKRQVITAGNLQLELKEGDSITLENALPMYDEVGMMGRSFDFSLINKTTENTKYTIKLKDVTEGTKKLDTLTVKYGLTKDGVVTKDLLSNLTDNTIDTGVISGNQTTYYNLRLWIDSNVEDEELIKGKSLSYKIEVEATLDTNTAIAKSIVFDTVAEDLGENCKTYDDGIDTFLVGQCSQNYVWYSGKLWRVVKKNNETGAVKMVTDNAITTISYNISGDTAFEDSYMDQWLNQEFLPTLHDYQDYLVTDSIWDVALDDSNAPDRPLGETIVTRTVGLLNAYELYTTYNNSDGLATRETGYLNKNIYWWLMTPYNLSNVRLSANGGGLLYSNLTSGYGVCPSVNLKSSIHVIQGNGTKSEPYKLRGDSSEIAGGTTLLTTRYSGEYVTFNNELYRIVGVENNLTKIIAVDKPAELSGNKFHNSDGVINFADASIKTDLETYYQNNVTEPYKSMIEPNTTWYLGTVADGENYKATICKTVNIETSTNTCERIDTIALASIGLPRVGEMFTSYITRGTRAGFWTLTPKDRFSIRFVRNDGTLYYNSTTSGMGIRPSMYLKANVIIASTNTGDGTYEHPYAIESLE